MLSFASKRILAFLFTALVVAPMFFLAPLPFGESDAHAGPNTFYLESIGNFFIGAAECLWSPIDCIIELFFITLPQFIFGLAGAVFDILLAFSLSSTVIKNQVFVNKGWVIMRDLSNTFFIFILLYIAISTILQLAGGQTKRLLATLVMVALFMNFSLYITKFVIDVGNVFALEFYVNMGEEGLSFIKINGDITPRVISPSFINAFNLQQLTGNLKIESSLSGWALQSSAKVLIGIMYLVAAFVFFSAGFLFLARVVAFWFLMILSPLAFFSMILPSMRGKIWGPWSSQLVNQSFFLPIFLFFIYLTLMLAKTIGSIFAIDPTAASKQEFVVTFLLTFLTFFALITVLLFALKTAKSMSGTLGQSMLTIGQKITGTAVGVGLGATAWAGRKYIGGYGRDYLQQKDEEGRTREERMRASRTGRLLLGATGDMGTKASFDVRGIGGDKLARMGGLDIGTAQKGGYNAQLAEKVKAKQAEYDSIQDPKLKAQYLASNMDKDVSFALYSKMSAKERMEMAAKSPQHAAMFQSFAQRMGGKEQTENHKEAIANAKDVRDKNTGAITKSKDVVRAEYLHNMENIGTSGMTVGSAAYNTQRAKNLNAQREALESMSADDVSDMLAAAKNNTSVTGPAQVKMIQEAIGRTGHEKQVAFNQAILRDVKEKKDPITGATIKSATQRADIINAVPNPEIQKALWAKETPEMRAEILAATPGLQILEDSLSDDQREQTRSAKIRVKQRTETAKRKTDIEDAITQITNPASAPAVIAAQRANIELAVRGLSSQQFAALDQNILASPEMERHLNRNRINAIATRGELDATAIHDLILKHLDQKIPAGHAPLTGDALEEMKKLYKDDKIKGYLDQAERDRIKAAI